MNRYPLWKYVLLAVALMVGLLYTLPNFFGQAPAVQVSSAKTTVKVDDALAKRVEEALKAANLQADFVEFEGNSVRARFGNTDTQIKAKDVITKTLIADPSNPSYVVALNLVSRSPAWLKSINALPMYLGLDLRGGVHFLMQVDMRAVLTKRAESMTADARSLLRDKNVRHGGVERSGNDVIVRAREETVINGARDVLVASLGDFDWRKSPSADGFELRGSFKPEAARRRIKPSSRTSRR
jgi:preprotein translocase subunit SecD